MRHHAKEDQQPQTKHMTSLQAKLLPVRAFPSHLLVEPQHGHVPVAVAARCTSSCASERRWQRRLLASRDATQMRMSNRNQASALSRLEGKHSCVASSCMCVRRYSICRAADRRAPVSVSVGACCTCGWQRPCRTAMAMWIPRIVRRHAKKDPQPQTKRITSLQAKLLPMRAYVSFPLTCRAAARPRACRRWSALHTQLPAASCPSQDRQTMRCCCVGSTGLRGANACAWRLQGHYQRSKHTLGTRSRSGRVAPHLRHVDLSAPETRTRAAPRRGPRDRRATSCCSFGGGRLCGTTAPGQGV